ncbi:MAG: hypothetical protein JNN07_16590 [Verrucomicrobiales bacterium]|nr:hypothetical protein [Verrucomicrobiales bacterium]
MKLPLTVYKLNHTMSGTPDWDSGLLDLLWRQLTSLRSDLEQAERRAERLLRQVHPTQLASAKNLVHYLAMRQHDLRSLQEGLAAVGLSSLGRAESHVLATIDSVIAILESLLSKKRQTAVRSLEVSFREGRSLLKTRAEELLGRKPAPRFVRIMVTMSEEAATCPLLMEELLLAGMNCLRINCAHDDSRVWSQMIQNLRQAETKVGRNCRIHMDLAGPKIRTGPIESCDAVIKWKPSRDAMGRVVKAAKIWMTVDDHPEPPSSNAAATVPVPKEWLSRLRVGDAVRFTDLRAKRRLLVIVAREGSGWWAESSKTAFIGAGTKLRLIRGTDDRKQKRPKESETCVSALAPEGQPIVLKVGDLLHLSRSLRPGRPARVTPGGRVSRPARIGCTAPEVFLDVKAGEEVWFDDGKIGGIIESARPDRLKVRIVHARAKGEKLWADKGINFPGSRLRLRALTEKDVEDLPFVVTNADLVGYSFVQTPADVEAIQAQLKGLQGERLGLVLKIETRSAFEQLPYLLLAAMSCPVVGVMIARGDLAVECGYERLAEIQEEILWVCEAAHMPVIWATQVLESLARDGLPSRAEVTDAAMGVRAECVMLNKGPQLVAAVRALDGILRRMEAHQNKKASMLRSLEVARSFNPVIQPGPRRVRDPRPKLVASALSHGRGVHFDAH